MRLAGRNRGNIVYNMLISLNSFEQPRLSPWETCLSVIKSKVDEFCYQAWFVSTRLLNPGDENLVIEAQNTFAADYIEENFIELVEFALSQAKIEFKTISFSSSLSSSTAILENINAPQKVSEKKQTRKKAIKNSQLLLGPFRDEYRLETFITGESNELAYTSCLAVAEAPGKTSFNPLFIHGKTGLGKTHLLQAVGHFAYTEETAAKVLYLSSKDFIDRYMEHLKLSGNSASFSGQFEDVDLLLIDDIHFLSGKEATQKEFFRIFNNLLSQKKQIILTSDCHPEKIKDMMDRLINRFLGGLVLDIQPPAFDTRIEILKSKAKLDGIELPDEVVQYIAGHVTKNVRELEGTLLKLIASASFTGEPISIETAATVFGDVIQRKNHKISVDSIQAEVAMHFGINVNQLRAHTRKKSISYPRDIAIYLCKKLTKLSLKTIGLDFGNRDYSTIIYTCKKMEEKVRTDLEIARHCSIIETKLSHLK